MQDLIRRINELYHKSQADGLTPEEKAEQEILRRRYIDNVKENFRAEIRKVKKAGPGSC